MKLRKFLLSTVLPLCLLVNSATKTAQPCYVSFKQNASAEEILLPTPTGQYRIGRTSFHRIDASRPEPFTEDTADHRQALFHIWYPAEPAGGAPAPYIDLLPDNEIFRKSYSGVGIEKLVKTRSHAFTGAGISDARRRYPIIIFSHGLGSVSALYTTILENLASHGYIVVGVDSPFFSSAVKLPDGRIVKNESQRNRRKGAREEEAAVQAQDLIFVLNELEWLNKNDPEKRFTGRFDLKRVGVFGHSRGGFAAPHACLLDRRFRACLNLDGYPLTPAVMEKGIRQPYMHIEEIAPWEPPPTDEELAQAKQTREQAIEEAREAEEKRETTFGKMSSGMYLVVVKGAEHGMFSDAHLIAPERYNTAIAPARALTITNAYVLAFFDRYLQGRQQTLLKGVTPMFPEVTLEIYPPGRGAKKVFSSKGKSQ
jgi:predicted dienelactone hydrolase